MSKFLIEKSLDQSPGFDRTATIDKVRDIYNFTGLTKGHVITKKTTSDLLNKVEDRCWDSFNISDFFITDRTIYIISDKIDQSLEDIKDSHEFIEYQVSPRKDAKKRKNPMHLIDKIRFSVLKEDKGEICEGSCELSIQGVREYVESRTPEIHHILGIGLDMYKTTDKNYFIEP